MIEDTHTEDNYIIIKAGVPEARINPNRILLLEAFQFRNVGNVLRPAGGFFVFEQVRF